MTTYGATHEAGVPSERPLLDRPVLGRQGVWILVISLSMLFSAGIALLVLARTGGGGHLVRDPSAGARLALPVWLWVSTFFLFVSSVALHQGREWIKLGLPVYGLRSFRAAMAVGWVFAVLQIPGLVALTGRFHPASSNPSPAYFLVLVLVALHALHAVGGLVTGTTMAWKLEPGALTDVGVERLYVFAIYWHFVVIVWLALFMTFSLV
jgi:heme/copper-type cytochrome/quinol oxidase subunit 3